MRYFLHLAYNGAAYRGWQWQPNAISVQQTIEDALGKMLHMGKPVSINGCGRTDAGVHASQYFAHADLPEQWDYDPIVRLNRMLPADISVFELIPMPAGAHVQYDARARTYEYYFHTRKNAILSHTSTWYSNGEVDGELLLKAANLIGQAQNFRAFCKKPDLYNNTICNITEASIDYNSDLFQYRFKITSNRFLRAMIRLLVAKMLDVSSGKFSLDQLEMHLMTGKELQYMLQAPAQGLFLSKVVYPYLERPTYKG